MLNNEYLKRKKIYIFEDERKEMRQWNESLKRHRVFVARRNSSLVKGAIIQWIAPGRRLLQTNHKLWPFNFAILNEISGWLSSHLSLTYKIIFYHFNFL